MEKNSQVGAILRKWSFIIILVIVPLTSIFSQKIDPVKTEKIFVYFVDGVERVKDYPVEELQKMRSNVSLLKNEELIVTNTKMVRVMDSLKLPLSNIKASFPDFDLKDTVSTLPNGEVVKDMNLSNVFTVTVPDGMTSQHLIDYFAQQPNVLYAEPAGGIDFLIVPNENDCATCEYNDQYHLDNTVNPGMDIHARGAWNIYRGSSSQRIGVFDSGVESSHPELLGKVNGSTTILAPHGTSVAGIIAGRGNNGDGISGVNWNANIYSMDLTPTPFLEDPAAYDPSNASKLRTIASQSDVSVINHSWGTKFIDGTWGRNSSTLRSAFAYAYKRNKINVAAGGNQNLTQPGDPSYPAAWDEYLIAVAATDINDQVTDFSVRGDFIDVAAAGDQIMTLTTGGGYDQDPIRTTGTSFSSPQVTGVASLLKGMRTELCQDDIRSLITISADDLNDPTDNSVNPGVDHGSGHGRLNAEEALKLLLKPNEMTFRSITGGTDYSTMSNLGISFLGVTGLNDGFYVAERHEVRRTVTSSQIVPPSHVWGRGYYSRGFNTASPNMGTNHVDVVSVSGRNITLRTYVYKLSTLLGQEIGWFPSTPANVVFAWAELYTKPGTIYDNGFEQGLGQAYNSGTNAVDWVIRSGGTPSSGTGPSAAAEGSNYLYIEASSPNFPSKTGTITFPGYSGLGRYRLRFKYHMYGADMGSLKLKYVKPGQGTYTTATYSGDKGNQWNSVTRYLYDMSSISFEATTGSGYRSDIAIDDIEITRLEDYPVVWTDLVNTNPDGSSIFKTSGATNWNAGAASNNVIPGNVEGWVETRITDYQSDFMLGLSYTNDNASWNSIDFNLYVSKYNSNVIRVYERGTLRNSGTTYEVGDVVAVHRLGSSVYFKKNGVTFYTLNCDQSKSLVADICLYNGNLSLYDVRINHPSTGASSSRIALNSTNQFDEVFGDPTLLQLRPVGDDYPRDTVTVKPPSVETSLFSNIDIYPNESAGKFEIKYELKVQSSLTATVRDKITGEDYKALNLKKDKKGSFVIDITAMKDETYLLELSDGNRREVFRLVKKSN